MNRRSFIGATLGFFLGTKIPFIPEAPKPIKQFPTKLEKAKAKLGALEATNLSDWKVIVLASNGEKFYAPGFKEIAKDSKELNLEFFCEGVEVTTAIEFTKVELVNAEGMLIGQYPINIFAINGDTLYINYKLTVGI